ncbi:unnamed protein product [Hymenolepis diminuta]|uniref:RT_RNaseH_2 domain-containing protein n=1 Tax=Hymenolepis diminuta TaxID=6216 RepID=A0A564XVC2_HYMDI|nr:unnamed protein product [Hymenolepis diminuta]
MMNFYPRFLPSSASMVFRSHKANFSFSAPPKAVTVFEETKTLLPDCSMLAYQEPEAILALSIDSSQVAVGTVLK